MSRSINKLSIEKYDAYLKVTNDYFKSHNSDTTYWDFKTGTCGSHLAFTLDALGVVDNTPVGYISKNIMHLKDIVGVLQSLDDGKVVECAHDYRTAKFKHLPKDNRYGNHVFAVFRIGDKYFMSQGYMHRYKSSIISYTREEIREMFTRIITEMCDYDNNKTWADINFQLHEHYFRTKLNIYPNLPAIKNRKVHGIVLFNKVF